MIWWMPLSLFIHFYISLFWSIDRHSLYIMIQLFSFHLIYLVGIIRAKTPPEFTILPENAWHKTACELFQYTKLPAPFGDAGCVCAAVSKSPACSRGSRHYFLFYISPSLFNSFFFRDFTFTVLNPACWDLDFIGMDCDREFFWELFVYPAHDFYTISLLSILLPGKAFLRIISFSSLYSWGVMRNFQSWLILWFFKCTCARICHHFSI